MNLYLISASTNLLLKYATTNYLPLSSCVNTAPIACSCAAMYNLHALAAFGAQHWWRVQILFDLVKRHPLFSTPNKLSLMLEPYQWQKRLHPSC
jgi:hypothetical protein